MSKSYRIRTTPGGDNGYLKVNIDLTQNFDQLELLSLKISQKDEYQSFCSEYGVIAGRVIINNGFGVPNVKVSIFVPVDDNDLENPVISEIYPYKTTEDKNGKDLRYNLLPKTKQSLDHTPVGSFPKKREVLDNGTIFEIYEKYYKYTTTTNQSGDYILFGIPVGEHQLHYDMDVSDIGFLSTRPYELINQGYSEDLFQDRFKFKSSNNLDSLPQIFSQNIPVDIEPYWCDSLSVGSPIGINRYDITISTLELVPTSVFMGSIFSDDENDSVNANCSPGTKMGRMNELITSSGKLEAIRRTTDGNIETFSFNDNSIDENGNWSVLVPMNLRKVVTDEFGNLVPSPDGIKGIATEGDYRFRVSMDKTTTDKKLKQRAKYLVPNTNNNFNFKEYTSEELKNSLDFTLNTQLSTITQNTPYEFDLRNQYNYLEEFFPFRWKKMYTVKQYIGRFQTSNNDEIRDFIGIKDIYNSEGVNKFPFNRMDTKFNGLYSIICVLLSLFGHVVGVINGIINIINGLVTAICNIRIPVGLRLNLRYCFDFAFNLCNRKYKDNCIANYSSLPSGSNDCYFCKCNVSGDARSEFTIGIEIKWRCLFSPLFCKKCTSSCSRTVHGCCPDGNTNTYVYDRPRCGSQSDVFLPIESTLDLTSCCGDCCIKVPLIPLRCSEESTPWNVTLIPTPFAAIKCNQSYVLPFGCISCGGFQTAGIKDWVSCVMEPVAVYLKMLKFDFYNDWVGGSLYFPLIKRKYKLKKTSRKFGQIKKDKFCDFDCRQRNTTPPPDFTTNFQGNTTYKQWRIKIPNITLSNPSITVDGCTSKIRKKKVTEWYGTVENDLQTYNLNLAVKEFILPGVKQGGNGCNITFETFSDLSNLFNSENIPFIVQDKDRPTEHGKPKYIKTEGTQGVTSWKNVGGHGHHRNICYNTRLIERKEYFKTILDCIPNPDGTWSGLGLGNNLISNDNLIGNSDGTFPTSQPEEGSSYTTGTCQNLSCKPKCGTNGVAPCNNIGPEYYEYSETLVHGIVSWEDGEIYYTPYVSPEDQFYNSNEYKGNILFPTTILELGSTMNCDIDDAPFIIGELPTTTFNVSSEDVNLTIGNATPYGVRSKIRNINKTKSKDGSINLRSYVEYSCFSPVCMNTIATVNSSQLGVDIIDKNDIGVEIGSCFVRFDHDDEIRSYFCKKFNGYKGNDLSFHHSRPGSIEFDNEYNTYPEIKLTDGYDLYYRLPIELGNEIILSEYNDGEYFIPGDGCGYREPNKVDYFYGVAAGQTTGFINYPNVGNQTINFGQTAQGVDGTDEVFELSNSGEITLDINNGSYQIKGIKFNRSQTPYYLYFGIVPGKTALHKTVGKFFADKINAVTLEGISSSDNKVSENLNNTPNISNEVANPFSIYRTCLGDTLIENVKG